jgi:hypothetical protein
MRISFLLILVILGMTACQSKRVDPAAGAPRFPIYLERFDSAFFNIDTLHTSQSIDSLLVHYPNFTTVFLTQILMLQSVQDTGSIKMFYRLYKPVYLEAQRLNAIGTEKPILEEGFKRLHFYFPKYPLTHKLTLFVGPFEQFGNIITKDAVAIGLQMHLGKSSSWYAPERMQTRYPNYISTRFTPNYIAVITMKNLLNDLEPLKEQGNLITQIIESGKRQYILKACLPNLSDTLLFGYSDKQLSILNKEESKIWEYMVAEKLSYSNNESDISDFLQEGDNNQIFGDLFPGNVGKYIGYKIVDAWMHQKSQANLTMEKMLSTPAQQIFLGANYAP